MKRICLVTCFMGTLPRYYPYFYYSALKNPTIDFIVLGDFVKESVETANVKIVKTSLAELSKIASEKLGQPMNVANAWKINEYKPAFGILFKEYLEKYDFWGWCDLDIVWGNVRSFLTEELLNSYDVVSSKEKWSAGHFTLFRNTSYINNLFNDNPKIIELLNSDKYFAFEESCQRWNGEMNSIPDLVSKGLPVSMFDIIKSAEREKKLKARFKDIIREHPQPIDYTYANGELTDNSNGEKFMYYHLITVKKIWRFYIPEIKKDPTGLFFTAKGISTSRQNLSPSHFIWSLKRASYCLKGITTTFKKEGLTSVLKRKLGFEKK